ncbi:MAG: ABC transporter permease [Candidatus Jettenia caeni]|nr:MAG: ABC transporter permease [Candidatus Jettenia caeni]
MHEKSKYTVRIILFLLVLFVIAILVSGLSPYDPLNIDLNKKFMEPSLLHLCGTDELGRDVLSRVLHGFSTTICVSIIALLSSLVVGICLGGIAGYFYGSWLDCVFNWVVSLIFSLPFLLVMSSVMSIIKPGIGNAYMILTCIMWVGPARITRAEVIKTRNLGYVLNSRAFGYPEWHILLFTIMPATVESAFTFSISYLPEIIGLEAGLSFLGLGVQPPYPGLGKMIFDGLNYIYSAWWLALFPALSLFLIVMVINLFVMWDRRRSL